ncbi:Pilus assembly protein, PilO [Sterolibacterium denitrificans]|uniref:Pilus assembly protein, PilO n=1 Tax=Sterolibacterium denitrificans TaxID=157592 RepID=A0A7Z7MV89_9PROT|nr:Pilus assembly protein, PilO [Sterolibacterium denitrificans]
MRRVPALRKPSVPAVDFQAILEDFKTLDPKDPGAWPLVPRIATLLGVFLMLLLSAWWFGWNSQFAELDTKRQEESRLKDEWLDKKKQAVNLDEYSKQLAEIDRSFGTLLRQLPDKAEMESMLVDINQSGIGRGLQFELFKPGTEALKDFYAELPITIKLVGRYHDLGAFTGDIAKLSRIVTLNDIDVTMLKDNALSMTMVAKTFRYLDEAELSKQKREKQAKGKAGGKK